MRILLVTVSARGHAIAEALARSPQRPEIIHICPIRNPGIRRIASEQVVVDSVMNFSAILEVAKRTLRPSSGQAKPDFAFIAPDDPIAGGLADELSKVGIPSVAPKKALARIESSKAFARLLLQKHGIDASPRFSVFDRNGLHLLPKVLRDDLKGDYVVKYDGLLGGKGVKVSGEHLATVEEGVAYARECIEKSGQVVVEEKLQGPEFSLMSFVSAPPLPRLSLGNSVQVVDMPVVQDFKRAYEGDTGPNTGGMGSYSCADHLLPFLTKEDLAQASEINRRTIEALMKECGEPFKGILYGGYMVTASGSHPERGRSPSRGVKLIEFNARFGDPEALNVLPLLETDFVAICQAIIEGTLNDGLVRFAPKATVCKYIVPEGYPMNKDQKGQLVQFPENIPSNARIYYGDVREERHSHVLKNLRTSEIALCLGGSRAAGIVGIADTTEEAERIAQRLCEQVQGPVRFRKDIGTKALVEQRISLMRELRR